MKYFSYVVVLFILLLLQSCNNKTELENHFSCTFSVFSETKQVVDFNNKFTLDTPTNWKTNYYYNSNQSEIFVADTTKELSKTYIVGATYKYSPVTFVDNKLPKLDSILTSNQLSLVSQNYEVIKNLPSVWYVAKGIKNGFEYHIFQVFMQQSSSTHFMFTSELYGNSLINERLCESFSILKTLKFSQ